LTAPGHPWRDWLFRAGQALALAAAMVIGTAPDAVAQGKRDAPERKFKAPPQRTGSFLGLGRERPAPTPALPAVVARVARSTPVKPPAPKLVAAARAVTLTLASEHVPPPHVAAALDNAARTMGLEPTLLHAMAWSESRFDPSARNRRSTARGLMQFTEATWLEVVRDFGPRHGLGHQAALLITNHREGTISAPRWQDRRAILALRNNPRLAALMAAERVAKERRRLTEVLGREAQSADLYFVHLLGPSGAREFAAGLRHAPQRIAMETMGKDSAHLNREMFTERATGRVLTVAEVHQQVERWLGERRTIEVTRVAMAEPAGVSLASGHHGDGRGGATRGAASP
jgi:hypothetical protein